MYVKMEHSFLNQLYLHIIIFMLYYISKDIDCLQFVTLLKDIHKQLIFDMYYNHTAEYKPVAINFQKVFLLVIFQWIQDMSLVYEQELRRSPVLARKYILSPENESCNGRGEVALAKTGEKRQLISKSIYGFGFVCNM